MSKARIEDLEFGFDDEGAGEALVLVHGHPFDRSMWRPQVERFGESGWRVIAPDLRGYGESSVVPGKTTLESFARDIAALLDRLAVGEIVLGGLSMGGQIVMEFCRLFPGRVRGLLLADTSPLAETEAGKKARHEAADRLLREGMGGYAREALPKMVTPRNIVERPGVARHVLGMMLETPPQGAAAALRGRAERPDYLELLASVAVPALVVVGRDDEFTPVRDAEVMVERLPNATLAIIEGAGHMPNLERPAAFNEALQGLLDEVAAAAAAPHSRT